MVVVSAGRAAAAAEGVAVAGCSAWEAAAGELLVAGAGCLCFGRGLRLTGVVEAAAGGCFVGDVSSRWYEILSFGPSEPCLAPIKACHSPAWARKGAWGCMRVHAGA